MIQFQPGGRRNFLAVDEYTPQEQLLVLIDAMMLSAEHRINVEEDVLAFLYEHTGTKTLLLYSEYEDREMAKFEYDSSRRQHVDAFIHQLKLLREEVTHE